MTIQDWGVTYDELEPYYDRFEYLCGTSGNAGNLKGKIQPGGNPFEGPRSRPYPTPAQRDPMAPTMFADAARELGYHPFPQPSANLSQAYTNPLGVRSVPCTYCGFCERFGCGNYSKASPQTTLLPVLMRDPNFEARTRMRSHPDQSRQVRQARHRRDLCRHTGNEWEQPAEIVLLCAFMLFNVQLLLLSGIGKPYDVNTRRGRDRPEFLLPDDFYRAGVLRQQDFQPVHRLRCKRDDASTTSTATISTTARTDFGGGYIGMIQTNGRPIETTPVPPGTKRWGAEWKKAVADNYLSSIAFFCSGSNYSYRDNYLDLDPTYKDHLGRPLMRMTFDFHPTR